MGILALQRSGLVRQDPCVHASPTCMATDDCLSSPSSHLAAVSSMRSSSAWQHGSAWHPSDAHAMKTMVWSTCQSTIPTTLTLLDTQSHHSWGYLSGGAAPIPLGMMTGFRGASAVQSMMGSAGGAFKTMVQVHQSRSATQLSRVRVPKSAGINDTIMPNNTVLQYGLYGIRAMTGKRVAANTIEAVRRTLRRRLKKDAKLYMRIEATVPVTRKPEGIRMGKGKGAIAFYATPVRPGQILFEFDRVPRNIAIQAMTAIQAKFPCRLGFVEWS